MGGESGRHLIGAVSRLEMGGLDTQHLGFAIRLQIDPGDDLTVHQERQHVVAVDALRLRHVDLDAVVEVEEAQRPEFQFPLQTGFEEMTWGNVIPTREEQETLLSTAGFDGAPNRVVIGEGFTILSIQR